MIRGKYLLSQDAFTLIELLVVLIIMSILMSVAVTSQIGARKRANSAAAPANVRAILPSITAFYADNGTYENMTLAELKSEYDQNLDVSKYSFGASSNLTQTSYCVESSSGEETWRKLGPSAPLERGSCPAAVTAGQPGAQERADSAPAPANIRAILPAITAFYADNGTYENMTLAELKSEYDQNLDVSKYSFGASGNLTQTSYCVESSSGGETWRKLGPSAPLERGSCPA